MSLDINKVVIKTSLASCFGSHFKEVEGANAFIDELAQDAEEISFEQGEYVFREKDAPEYVYIPESGSLIPIAKKHSPDVILGIIKFFCSSVPNLNIWLPLCRSAIQ